MGDSRVYLAVAMAIFSLAVLGCRDGGSASIDTSVSSDIQANDIAKDGQITDSHGSPDVPTAADQGLIDTHCPPQCKGKECGDDGCGGSCGTCSDNQFCSEGQCKPKPDSKCLSDVSCVDDSDCLRGERCNKAVKPPSCQKLYCGGFGTACSEDVLCLSQICKSNQCAPDCMNSECGPDPVYGESCGTCGGGRVCVSGKCVCAPKDHLSCCGNNICWVDSCGRQGAITKKCPLACLNAKCVDCDELGMANCSGTCRKLGTSANCSGCGDKCTGGKTCQDGQCKCPAGQVDCSGKCMTLGTNTNCSGCGDKCTGGKTCQDGQCKCPENQVNCSDTCPSEVITGDTCAKVGACLLACDETSYQDKCKAGSQTTAVDDFSALIDCADKANCDTVFNGERFTQCVLDNCDTEYQKCFVSYGKCKDIRNCRKDCIAGDATCPVTCIAQGSLSAQADYFKYVDCLFSVDCVKVSGQVMSNGWPITDCENNARMTCGNLWTACMNIH